MEPELDAPRHRLTTVEADFLSHYLKRGRGLTHESKLQILDSHRSRGLGGSRERLRLSISPNLHSSLDELLFVLLPQGETLVAEAIAFGPRSRMVAVSGGVPLAALIVGTVLSVYTRTFPQNNAWRRPFPTGKTYMHSADFLDMATSWGSEEAAQPRDVRLSESKRLFDTFAQSPSATFRSAAAALISFPHSDATHLYFADQIIDFTVAHEVAHQLLEHQRPGKNSQVAREWLGQQLSELDYTLPDVKSAQRQEHEADALALMWMLRGAATEAPLWDRALKAITGAFGAMMLFDVLEEAVGSPLGRLPQSHPDVEQRSAVLFDLVHLLCAHLDQPAWNSLLGRTVQNNPQHFAFQVWACRGFIRAVPTSALWLPGERPSRSRISERAVGGRGLIGLQMRN